MNGHGPSWDADATRTDAPPPEELRQDLEAAIRALEHEDSVLRPADDEGKPGGLLRLPEIPAYIIPDLHARGWILPSLLKGRRVIDLLEGGTALVLCLGDVLHSEGKDAALRWKRALDAMRRGAIAAGNPEMDLEMGLALRCLQTVLRLKARFSAGFHCLKGNHDNMANLDTGGDLGFYKYADEGAMGAAWFEAFYGRDMLALMRRYETSLPVAAAGSGFCASHAEPAFAVDEGMVRNSRLRPDVVRALIWTANGDSNEGAVRESLDALLGSSDVPGRPAGTLWFSGHRPVRGNFGTRAEGRLIQLHNPEEGRAAFVVPSGAGSARWSPLRIDPLPPRE